MLVVFLLAICCARVNLSRDELGPFPTPQVLEKAIFNEDVINARHDWGTRYLEWTSKAFTLDR